MGQQYLMVLPDALGTKWAQVGPDLLLKYWSLPDVDVLPLFVTSMDFGPQTPRIHLMRYLEIDPTSQQLKVLSYPIKLPACMASTANTALNKFKSAPLDQPYRAHEDFSSATYGLCPCCCCC